MQYSLPTQDSPFSTHVSWTQNYFPAPTPTQAVSVPTVFDQVVARYRKELQQLADDPNFKPHYIGIREACDEIHVWALVDETDQYTYTILRNIQSDLNAGLLLAQDRILLTFYFYPQHHGKATPSEIIFNKLFPL